jgi:hypothetical protein
MIEWPGAAALARGYAKMVRISVLARAALDAARRQLSWSRAV